MLMNPSYFEFTGLGMGTVIEQKIGVANLSEGEKICQKASAAIKELEYKMSYFIKESSISRLNTSNNEDFVDIDCDTFEVLKAAKNYYALSNGAFDITAAPITAIWRDCINRKALPAEDMIMSLLPHVSGDNLSLNEENHTARIGKMQSVDLGGIGKGYAADRVLELYKGFHINSAFINLGGNVHTLGNKLNGEPWMIGIQDPRSVRGDFIAALEISGLSVVTSGDYEKYFETGGKRIHHILDPKTGYPADSGLISATVLAESSMEADALSTAVFVSGLERGMELIEQSPGAEGVMITKDKDVYVTHALKERFVIAQSKTSDYHFYFYR